MIDSFDLSNPDKPVITKDPDAVLDYSQDWSAWLTEISDAIASASVAAEVPLVISDTIVTGSKVTTMIGGGVVTKTHAVTFRITTVAGRIDERSIYLKIRQR